MRHRHFKFGTLFLILAFVGAPPAAHSGDIYVQLNGSDQVLRWDFSGEERLGYDVDRFDPVLGKWNTVATKGLASIGEQVVPDGGLYRVNACNKDGTGNVQDCVSSDVVWVPLMPTEEEIPGSVVGAHGEVMVVHKNLDLQQQTEQYNVYLLVKTLDSTTLDIRSLPPMREVTDQQILEDGEITFDEILQRALYLNYSAKREYAVEEHALDGHRH